MATRVNADDRRRAVVAEAAELFDRDGYHTTSMSDLARAVGLEKPTLYHYFSGKDEILFWIHEEFIDLLDEQSVARVDTGLSASEELGLVIRDVLSLMETHRGHVRVFFEHHRELSATHRKTIRAKRDRYQARVQAIIERGIASGEFGEIDPRLATLAVFGACNWAYQWYRTSDGSSIEDISTTFLNLFIHGLRTSA
jgi:TetR/AcrR family transcriptional regulator, cholesterol catabolism regulator